MDSYRYELPDSYIAQRPLENRDSSRLLVVKSYDLSVTHDRFNALPEILASQHQPVHLVLNTTRVVAARLSLYKATGGAVEVLLNAPLSPSTDPQLVLSSNEASEWECMIGGRNVHAGSTLHSADVTLQAVVLSRNKMEATVRLQWTSSEPLLEILDRLGHIPLPPYIERVDDASDRLRYQTVFAANNGSVAAPTAGLHFTDDLLGRLTNQGIAHTQVTLHVGMGTFKPVEVHNAALHHMHSERVNIDRLAVASLVEALQGNTRIVPVGTTAMRSIESAYWLGVQILSGGELNQNKLHVEQFVAVESANSHYPAIDALHALERWMERTGTSTLSFTTQLMIAPGAHIGITGGLITNFHQPGSTLLLLVATLLGDRWRDVYQIALDNNYRFLSYGDAMLIIRNHDGSVATTSTEGGTVTVGLT